MRYSHSNDKIAIFLSHSAARNGACDALGMRDLNPVVIQHPLSTLTDEEIEQRAQQAAAQCVDILLGRSS